LPDVFKKVVIPQAVYLECMPALRGEIGWLGFWVESAKTTLFVQFGAGAREALNLALDDEWLGAFVLTDDRKAINAAARVGIRTITAFDFFAALKLSNRVMSTLSLVQKLRNSGEGINTGELQRMLEKTGE
jgi:predicted nucleic acid-binding protein